MEIIKIIHETRNSLIPRSSASLEEFVDLALGIGIVGPVKLKPALIPDFNDGYNFRVFAGYQTGMVYYANLFTGGAISYYERYERGLFLPGEALDDEKHKLFVTAIERRSLLRGKGLTREIRVFDGLVEKSDEDEQEVSRIAAARGIKPYEYVPSGNPLPNGS